MTVGDDVTFGGGGWGYGACYCRSANRGRDSPDYRCDSLGFRVACAPSH